MITRADAIWIVVLALVAFVSLRIWEVDTTTTIVAVLLVSVGRFAYAVYARRTWRR